MMLLGNSTMYSLQMINFASYRFHTIIILVIFNGEFSKMKILFVQF